MATATKSTRARKSRPTPANGAVLYSGPSMINGAPIVVVAIWTSTNDKTANMVQTYILRADMEPINASQTGHDDAICGDCPLRGVSNGKSAKGRSCYVNLLFAPRQIFNSFTSGRYPEATDAIIRRNTTHRTVRLGTYGDPAAVPVEVWTRLLKFSAGHTGYTHQWRNAIAEPLKSLVMASVQSEAEAQEAQAAGWRTFRIRAESQPVAKNEIVCPASQEAGKRLTCNECGACDGADRAGKVNVVIIGHGGIGVGINIERLINRVNNIG